MDDNFINLVIGVLRYKLKSLKIPLTDTSERAITNLVSYSQQIYLRDGPHHITTVFLSNHLDIDPRFVKSHAKQSFTLTSFISAYASWCYYTLLVDPMERIQFKLDIEKRNVESTKRILKRIEIDTNNKVVDILSKLFILLRNDPTPTPDDDDNIRIKIISSRQPSSIIEDPQTIGDLPELLDGTVYESFGDRINDIQTKAAKQMQQTELDRGVERSRHIIQFIDMSEIELFHENERSTKIQRLVMSMAHMIDELVSVFIKRDILTQPHTKALQYVEENPLRTIFDSSSSTIPTFTFNNPRKFQPKSQPSRRPTRRPTPKKKDSRPTDPYVHALFEIANEEVGPTRAKIMVETSPIYLAILYIISRFEPRESYTIGNDGSLSFKNAQQTVLDPSLYIFLAQHNILNAAIEKPARVITNTDNVQKSVIQQILKDKSWNAIMSKSGDKYIFDQQARFIVISAFWVRSAPKKVSILLQMLTSYMYINNDVEEQQIVKYKKDSTQNTTPEPEPPTTKTNRAATGDDAVEGLKLLSQSVQDHTAELTTEINTFVSTTVENAFDSSVDYVRVLASVLHTIKLMDSKFIDTIAPPGPDQIVNANKKCLEYMTRFPSTLAINCIIILREDRNNISTSSMGSMFSLVNQMKPQKLVQITDITKTKLSENFHDMVQHYNQYIQIKPYARDADTTVLIAAMNGSLVFTEDNDKFTGLFPDLGIPNTPTVDSKNLPRHFINAVMAANSQYIKPLLPDEILYTPEPEPVASITTHVDTINTHRKSVSNPVTRQVPKSVQHMGHHDNIDVIIPMYYENGNPRTLADISLDSIHNDMSNDRSIEKFIRSNAKHNIVYTIAFMTGEMVLNPNLDQDTTEHVIKTYNVDINSDDLHKIIKCVQSQLTERYNEFMKYNTSAKHGNDIIIIKERELVKYITLQMELCAIRGVAQTKNILQKLEPSGGFTDKAERECLLGIVKNIQRHVIEPSKQQKIDNTLKEKWIEDFEAYINSEDIN